MRILIFPLMLSFLSTMALADDFQTRFQRLYENELGSVRACEQEQPNIIRVCSNLLKNEGNAPYILYHGAPTEKVMVLLHGLSDSPYYFRSIANNLFNQGVNVIVGLLPGHGKKDADADMKDNNLRQRWNAHAKSLMELAKSLGERRYLGGFSTGGTIATYYVLTHPNETAGLMLFSGAFELDESVESMAKIWGIKWLSKLMEGDYDEMGANPYKYSKVHGHTGLLLMDEIFAVRELIGSGTEFNIPLFVAHSEVDDTTMIGGVKWLAQQNKGNTQTFYLPAEADVCHADLVLNAQQIKGMDFDASKLEDPTKKCWAPKANPMHAEMLNALNRFVQKY